MQLLELHCQEISGVFHRIVLVRYIFYQRNLVK